MFVVTAAVGYQFAREPASVCAAATVWAHKLVSVRVSAQWKIGAVSVIC